ncbi:MAG: NAD(P)/FAD-dependent oxidoreductase [Proteobacteria bacterium]|nr:NAD(P)/FAD-dependent oxidoreductase [Pseudomonadota bacterium]
MITQPQHTQVAIIGAGFTGLAAAYELSKAGVSVVILEAEADIGGLAAAFDIGEKSEKLDRFYHHWFTNDLEVMQLIKELNLCDKVKINPSNTGMYYANQFFKLSTPWDLLKFKPLTFPDRIRLGLLTLKARKVENWQELENKTAAEWLTELGGENVYRIVWEPLLRGKFGAVADQISAVWFWNKLKLRGSSRGKGGEERLAYFKGGFVALVEALAAKVRRLGGEIQISNPVISMQPENGGWRIKTAKGDIQAERVISTPALPLLAKMIEDWASPEYLAKLNRINYLANVCLVLELDHSLSDTYWLNVNDPSFPFVGVIEHTNFQSAKNYDGKHIVYLSKYLPHTDALYLMNDDELLAFALPHLKRMFPKFEDAWIKKHHVWHARWAQPVVEKHYSQLIPACESPKRGLFLASMAQIYPEDRGTNYAIREGRRMGRHLSDLIQP